MYFALLDILRFLSAIAVLFHHTFLFFYGRLGIYLFFIISGFVIHFSLKKGIQDYVISRFLRLFPLFWVCCTITYLITIYYGVNLSIKNYLVSMLLFNDGKIENLVDGSYWTLTFELLFYFYIGVFTWIFSTRNLLWFYLGWFVISMGSFFFGVDQFIIFKLLCVRFAPYFIFGGVLALMVEKFNKETFRIKVIYIALLVASALSPLYITKKINEQKDVITNFTGTFDSTEMVIVLSFFILMPLIIYCSRFTFTKTKSFAKYSLLLGGITYPLYLLHWKIGNTLILEHGDVVGDINYYTILVAATLCIVAYVLSIYELPVRKFLKNKLTRS